MKHIGFVNQIHISETDLKLGSISIFDKVINLCELTAEKGFKNSARDPKNKTIMSSCCGVATGGFFSVVC